MSDNNNKEQVWYVTGATSGTGLALVEALLENGIKVVGTSRDNTKWEKLPHLLNNSKFLGLQVDITQEESVKESIEKTISHFGDLTHVVNNAGYGCLGSVEEVSDKEARELMDAMYFGPLNVIRNSLPYFRSKRFGYIFNISSVAGIKGISSFGLYSGPKFALTGVTEALAQEVKQFNIKISCVIIGSFKTGFQSANSFVNNLIPEYNTKSKWESIVKSYANTIQGDPKKFAKLMLEISTQDELPYNLLVGPEKVVFAIAESKVKDYQSQIDSQKSRNSNVLFDQ